jgi:hypothetical protein
MKKAFSFLMMALVAAVALVSCNKESAGNIQDELAPVEFTLEGEISATVDTRATEITTSNITSFNVTATIGSSSETAVSNFANIQFTKSGSVWKGGKYWPASNPSYHFYAANATMTHTTSGQTVSPTNASTDIVVGYIASPTYNQSNALTMNHIFAQIGTVTINAPTGFKVSDLKVSVKPKTSGTYNLKSGSWTTVGSEASSATYLVGTSSSGASISTAGGSTNGGDKDLWLVPGSYTLTVTYKLIAADNTASATINKTATVSITQGKNNNISATLPADGSPTEIEFTVTINPWSNENQGVTWN